MRRHGVSRHSQFTGDLTGSHAFGFAADKQAEHLKTSELSKSRKGEDNSF
jgi:hypothetical protein